MTPDVGVLSQLLNTLEIAFEGGYVNVRGEAFQLLRLLVGIEIAFLGLWCALGGQEVAGPFLKKVIVISFFSWVVGNFDTLTDQVLKGFTFAGNLAAGAEPSKTFVMTDPSSVLKEGFDLTEALFAYAQKTNTAWVGFTMDTIIATFGAVFILFAYFLIALQIFITRVEFAMVTALGLILVPFGAFKHTAFLAEKTFGAIISFGIKLMVLTFLVSISMPLLTKYTVPANPGWDVIFNMVFYSGTIMYLAWHAPSITAGLLTGGPSLSGLGLAATAGGLAGGAAGAAASLSKAAVFGGASMAMAAVRGAAASMGGSSSSGAASSLGSSAQASSGASAPPSQSPSSQGGALSGGASPGNSGLQGAQSMKGGGASGQSVSSGESSASPAEAGEGSASATQSAAGSSGPASFGHSSLGQGAGSSASSGSAAGAGASRAGGGEGSGPSSSYASSSSSPSNLVTQASGGLSQASKGAMASNGASPSGSSGAKAGGAGDFEGQGAQATSDTKKDGNAGNSSPQTTITQAGKSRGSLAGRVRASAAKGKNHAKGILQNAPSPLAGLSVPINSKD